MVEYLTGDEWKGLSRSGFRAAAAAALQWQAGMEPSFLPSFSPLCSHTLGCRHRCCDSDRFAWKKPFRLLGGGGEEESGAQGCGEAPHRSRSSSSSGGESAGSQAPFQRDKERRPRGITPEGLELLRPPFAAEWTRRLITLGCYNTSRLLYDCYKQQQHDHSQPPIERNITVLADFHPKEIASITGCGADVKQQKLTLIVLINHILGLFKYHLPFNCSLVGGCEEILW